MNEIKIFSNPQFGEIRTVTAVIGEPMFCLAEVCRALELEHLSYGNHVQICARLILQLIAYLGQYGDEAGQLHLQTVVACGRAYMIQCIIKLCLRRLFKKPDFYFTVVVSEPDG